MTKGVYIYILSSADHSKIYTGVTSNLYSRVYSHKSDSDSDYVKMYSCIKLVYWEFFNDIESAIHREKRIKRFKRDWKNKLINELNPEWIDLFDSVPEMQ